MSVRSVSRLQFLQGDFSGKSVALRPPWSVEENLFVNLCTGCGDCVNHCPTAILHSGRGGYPEVDFRTGECEFCGECVNRCKIGALSSTKKSDNLPPWQLKAEIGNNCLAFNNVICRTCAEQCEVQAIVFRLSAGQVPQPTLDSVRCNGCGACFASCPVAAVSIMSSAR